MYSKYDKYIDYNYLDDCYNRSIVRKSLAERMIKKKHGNAMSKDSWEQIKRGILSDCYIPYATKNEISLVEREYIIKKIENDFLDKIEWIPNGCYYNTYFHDDKQYSSLPVIPKSIWESIPIYIILMLVFSIFNEVVLAWSAITIFYIIWIVIEIKKFN